MYLYIKMEPKIAVSKQPIKFISDQIRKAYEKTEPPFKGIIEIGPFTNLYTAKVFAGQLTLKISSKGSWYADHYTLNAHNNLNKIWVKKIKLLIKSIQKR